MASLPSANVAIDDESGAFGAGDDVIAVLAAVPGTVAVECSTFASSSALLDEHGYTQGAAYAALHFAEPGLPVMFVACPVGTAGAVTHFDRSGVTGTSIVSVAAGANGVLDKVDATLTVTEGGTVGTDPIVLTLTCDGGFNTKTIRLGTATSYVDPYLGMTISFGAGTLVADDVVTYRSYGPRIDISGQATAIRTKLAEQDTVPRTVLLIGDLQSESEIDAFRALVQAIEDTDDRFTLGRANLRDQRRTADFVGFRGRTAGASLTFAEVGATGDTITRAAGSWVTDGFTVGDTIVITGAVASSGANNITAVIATLTATIITLGSEDLIDEGPITSATVTAYATLTFAEVGSTGDTVTRSSGSWVTDGFFAGMTGTVAGSSLNDGGSYDIETVSATVLTLDTKDLDAEVLGDPDLTMTAVESKATWRTAIIADVEDVQGDSARRIDTTGGYGSKLCPITGWRLRRPWAWAESLREYAHDVHIPCWRVADGAQAGWTLKDADKELVEHDERLDGGLLSANISCARSWNNEAGAFTALSLTRADPGSLLSRSHNMQTANVACATVQFATQREVGQTLELGAGGLATVPSLKKLEGRVNDQLEIALGNVRGEGPRASSATWEASRSDVLNVPGAQLNGVLTLNLNGTIEKIATTVLVPVGG